MFNIFVFLFAVVIETIIYCTIPTIIRLIKRGPFSNIVAWYFATVNFGLIFTTLRIIESKLLNVDPNSISADLLSGVFSFINVYILTYNKKNSQSFIKAIKENYKKMLKIIVVSLIILVILSLIIHFLSRAFINKTNNIWGIDTDNTTKSDNTNKVGLKEINSQNEFKKIISTKDYTLVFFTQPNCIFCEKALPVLENFSETYELTNIYNCEYINSFDVGFDIEGFPTMAIYKDGEFIAQKIGYSDNVDGTSYRLSLANFLREYSIIE